MMLKMIIEKKSIFFLLDLYMNFYACLQSLRQRENTWPNFGIIRIIILE